MLLAIGSVRVGVAISVAVGARWRSHVCINNRDLGIVVGWICEEGVGG